MKFHSAVASDLRRHWTAASRWRVAGPSPSLVFRPQLSADHTLAILITTRSRPVDVVVVARDSAGATLFEEALPATHAATLVISPEEVARVSEIRLAVTGGAETFDCLAVSGANPVRLARILGWLRRRRHVLLQRNAYLRLCGSPSERERLRRLFADRAPVGGDYARHLRQVTSLASARSDTGADRGSKPLISLVVPVYDTEPGYLDALRESFEAQAAGLGELILSDDGSTRAETLAWLAAQDSTAIKVLTGSPNTGIAGATNRGIAAGSSPWIGLLDHDDVLTPFALERIAAALGDHPQCQFLYTDEAIGNAKLGIDDIFCKPAFDPVLLSGVNYINHLSLYRRDRLEKIGGLRDGFQGSQDYDLLLRYLDGLRPEDVLHLPYPAYVWRRDGRSLSTVAADMAIANARKALSQRYSQAAGPAMPVEAGVSPQLHRVRFDLVQKQWPKVSVVIPSRDALPLISRVLEGLSRQTDYPDLEIIVVDNGSQDPAVLALYEHYRRGPVPFEAVIKAEPFNFSRAINRGYARASGELILLLNNDIEVREPNWLKEMVSCFAYPQTGIVGAKLLYPNGKIQHAGVIAGFGGLAGHWYIGCEADHPGPMGRLWVRQSLSVVTGACMLVSRACFAATGPLDEEAFAIAYNDVDFCLRAGDLGFRVVWTPFATLTHHESASRGSDETPQNIERFRREQEALRARHATTDFEDRALNPWYSKDHSEPRVIPRDDLPEARH